MTKPVELQIFGAYGWDSLSSQPEANENGIYLWTAPYQGKYLVFYVGETGTSYEQRFKEEGTYQLDGHWCVYDVKEFVKGHRVKLWEGLWKTKELRNTARLIDFPKHPNLSENAHGMLEAIQIFLLVPQQDITKRERKRIEAAIAYCLFDDSQPEVIRKFQDEWCKKSYQKYRYRKPYDEELIVTFKSAEKILGLKGELKV